MYKKTEDLKKNTDVKQKKEVPTHCLSIGFLLVTKSSHGEEMIIMIMMITTSYIVKFCSIQIRF